MNKLKKILLISVTFILSLLVLIFGLLIFVWLNPATVINEKNIKWGLTYAPKELLITWNRFDLKFTNEGFWGKSVRLDLEDLCVNYDPLLATCLPIAKIGITFNIKNFNFDLTHIDHLILHSSFVRFHLSNPSKKSDDFTLPDLRLPAFSKIFPAQLDLEKLGLIEVIASDINIQPVEGESYQGSAKIVRQKDSGRELEFTLEGGIRQGLNLQASVNLQIAISGHEKISVHGDLRVNRNQLHIHAPIRLTWQEALQFTATPQVRQGKIRFTTPVSLDWNRQLLKLIAGPYTERQQWRKGVVTLQTCTLVSRLNSSAGTPEKNELKCEIDIKPHRKIRGLKVISTDLKVAANLSTPEENQLLISTKAEMTGDNAFITANIQANGEIHLDLENNKFLEKSSGNAKVDLRIPAFQIWKEIFEETLFAIPAPLHSLNGPVEFLAEGTLPKWREQITGTAELKTLLADSVQKLLTETTAKFVISGSEVRPMTMDVDIDAHLTDVRLQAPPLKLENPPQFLPDKRFILPPKKNKKPSKAKDFELRWTAKAKTESPIQISTNLIGAPIPIAVDVSANWKNEIQGKIEILSFPFEIFKKKAKVDRIGLTFHPNSKAPELGGLILYSNSEVDIRVMLLGSTTQPRVEFESDPPLNRQQILSVLLFNKSLDELTEEEVNSTASVSRALSDGALGLFSLLFLSSTPIQSISYDPVEKAYTARVKLDDSTTLSLGSDFSEGRQFGVRRRLGGPWSVKTELRQEDSRPDVVLTLLEWLRRF